MSMTPAMMHPERMLEVIKELEAERDRLAGEVDFERAAGHIQFHRAEAAEKERDRLKAALEDIGKQPLITEMGDDDLDGAIEEGYDQCILTARKALGDAS